MIKAASSRLSLKELISYQMLSFYFSGRIRLSERSNTAAAPNSATTSRANQPTNRCKSSLVLSSKTECKSMAPTTSKTIPTTRTHHQYLRVNLDSSRAWMFQCCTEYGWWQTVSDVHPLRSKQINLDFYRKFCKESFGEDLWPDTERKNIEYGGLDIKAFNLLMSNGDEGTFIVMCRSLEMGQSHRIPRAGHLPSG